MPAPLVVAAVAVGSLAVRAGVRAVERAGMRASRKVEARRARKRKARADSDAPGEGVRGGGADSADRAASTGYVAVERPNLEPVTTVDMPASDDDPLRYVAGALAQARRAELGGVWVDPREPSGTCRPRGGGWVVSVDVAGRLPWWDWGQVMSECQRRAG